MYSLCRFASHFCARICRLFNNGCQLPKYLTPITMQYLVHFLTVEKLTYITGIQLTVSTAIPLFLKNALNSFLVSLHETPITNPLLGISHSQLLSCCFTAVLGSTLLKPFLIYFASINPTSGFYLHRRVKLDLILFNSF